MKFRYLALKSLMVLAAFGSLIACGKSTGPSSTRGSESANAVTAQLSTCSNGQSAVGIVYDDSDNDLTSEVQALVSASINPGFFGTVSGSPTPGSTGVDIRARLRMVNGQLSAQGSMIQLAIYDSNVGQPSTANPGQTIQPYTITMTQAVSANNNQIVFQDQYGKLALNFENRDPVKITGTIVFENSQNAVPGTSAVSGTLGRFALPACVLSN